MVPIFSVVVPTRNRPEVVRACLESLASQTFSDFEVIVCDNHTGNPCKAVFGEWADHRFRYVSPRVPLAMYENWEYACQFATGEYVAVVPDKTILRPSALAIAVRALDDTPVEIISWWNEGYFPVDQRDPSAGYYMPQWEPAAPQRFDPSAELRRRLTFDVRRGSEGVRYHWGKICFGAYRRCLVDRIRDRTGQLFFPIAPDYSSMTAALMLAESALDVGQPLQLSMNSLDSNGRRQTLYPAHARAFLAESDPSGEVLAALPLPGLYTSLHNLVAYDYEASIARTAGHDFDRPRIDVSSLVARAREDLSEVIWDDDAEKHDQYRILAAGRNRLSRGQRARLRADTARGALRALRGKTMQGLALHGRLEGLVRRVLGRPRREPDCYPTIVAAGKAADRHYGSSAVGAWSPGMEPWSC